MSQAVWVTIGIALGTAVGWLAQRLLLRARAAANSASGRLVPVPVATAASRQTKRVPPAGLRPRPKAFHGVSLKPGPNPCAVVRAVVDRRYLSDDAPALPLAGCDRARCECIYSHHADRRDVDDRRSGWGTFGGFAAPVAGGNRRSRLPNRRARPDGQRG